MLVFTLAVITESSKYSPVPSCFAVEAQPRKETRSKTRKNLVIRLAGFMMVPL
jgi:hypothetical protein